MKVKVSIENQDFEVEIADIHARPVKAVVDGETFEVWPEESPTEPTVAAQSAPPQQALQTRAASTTQPCPPPLAPKADRSKTVISPIPGLILSISVQPGDTVDLGQELCVLEAMKMKNILRASRPGKIARVLVSVQEHVQHGQILMEFSD